MFYSLWYNAPKLLPAGGPECRGTDYVFGVKDVARLESSNVLHLVVVLHYLNNIWSSNIPTPYCKTTVYSAQYEERDHETHQDIRR